MFRKSNGGYLQSHWFWLNWCRITIIGSKTIPICKREIDVWDQSGAETLAETFQSKLSACNFFAYYMVCWKIQSGYSSSYPVVKFCKMKIANWNVMNNNRISTVGNPNNHFSMQCWLATVKMNHNLYESRSKLPKFRLHLLPNTWCS